MYSIKDLEILSGIKAHTIRIWEKRYNLLVPERSDTNIRYYNDEDLKKILNISMLVKHGYKISRVAEMDVHKMKEAIISISDTPQSEFDFLEKLTFYLINFDHLNFNVLLDEIIRIYGFNEALKKIVFPFFERVGTYWQVGSIFPAQEHYLSNIFRQKLIVKIDKLGFGCDREGIVLFFLHENEMHELSLLYYTWLARKSGYDVIYLGQFVPLDDLRKISNREEIKFVFTAFLNSIGKEELENYLAELRDIFQGRKIFITGCQVLELKPALPRNVKVVADYRDFYRYFR